MYANQDLNYLSKEIDKNLSRILQHFNINLFKGHNGYTGPCPIHKSDNHTSFRYYTNLGGQYQRARWRCFTNHCDSLFIDSSIGFVQGLLSSANGWKGYGDEVYGFVRTVNWVKKFLKVQITDKENTDEESDGEFVEKIFKEPEPKILLTKQTFSDIIYPSVYFLNRNFSKSSLDFFQVGQPKRPIPKFAYREFVPIYNIAGSHIVGATCRSIFEKCGECGSWHDPNQMCPEHNFRWAYSKWKNWEFDRASSLYNLWHAKPHIKEQNSIILVESPGNIWRLWDAGFKNCVASYGTELSFGQIQLLCQQGITNLYLLYDNDKGGQEAIVRNGKKLWQEFYIKIIKIPKEFNDVGEIEDLGYIQQVVSSQL